MLVPDVCLPASFGKGLEKSVITKNKELKSLEFHSFKFYFFAFFAYYYDIWQKLAEQVGAAAQPPIPIK